MPKHHRLTARSGVLGVPITLTAVVWLILQVSGAPEWVWGALGLLLILVWCGRYLSLRDSVFVDLDRIMERIDALEKANATK